MSHELAYVHMILAIRMFQDIISVISAKAGEGFGLIQAAELSECKDLAGAFIATRLIDDLVFIQAVAKARRLVVEMRFYGADDVIEFDSLGCLFNPGDQFGYNHNESLVISGFLALLLPRDLDYSLARNKPHVICKTHSARCP